MGHSQSRRTFIQAGLAGAGVAGMGLMGGVEGVSATVNEGGIPLRELGRTGVKVTLIGLGGHHSTRHDKEAESIKLIRTAVDEGITFLDNAWDYHMGGGEERMGKAIEEGKLRDQVFLMTKVCGRDAKTARSNLEDSLKRLQHRSS